MKKILASLVILSYSTLAESRELLRHDEEELSSTQQMSFVTKPSASGLADLVIDSVDLSPPNPPAGEPVRFRARVRNAGSVSTPVNVWIGVGFAIDGYHMTSGIRMGPLAPGSSILVTSLAGPWPAAAGTYNLEAWVDDVDRIAESKESNNKWMTTIVVPQSHCSYRALSDVGNAASVALQIYESRRGLGSLISRRTKCSSLPDSFLISTPSVSAPPPESQERYFEEARDEIARTRSLIQIASLDYGEEALGYLAAGLQELHNNTPVGGPYPLVQVLYSDSTAPDGPSEVLEQMIADLASSGVPGEDLRFYLIVRTMSQQLPVSDFNHAKIVVRDREHAIVGGHNLSDYVLRTDPYHYDLSMKVSGDAARAASDQFDTLWVRAQHDPFPLTERHAASPNFPDGYGDEPPERYFADIINSHYVPPLPRFGEHSALNIFGLGRGNIYLRTHDAFEPHGDFSADHAIVAALNAADHHIRIVQHSLLNVVVPNPWKDTPQPIREAIWDAVFGRNVRVEMLISDHWSGSLSADAQSVIDDLYEGAGDYALTEYGTGEYPTQEHALRVLDCNLRVARFRSTGAPEPVNHAKFFMIDDQAFYVGAQNLYVNEFLDDLDDESGLELNDFGFLVDNAGVTRRVRENYWDILWLASQGALVHPEGRTSACAVPIHTEPLEISDSTQLDSEVLYAIPSFNTSLVRRPGVLSSANQSSVDLFPVAAIEIHGQSGITLDCAGAWIQSQTGDLATDRSNDRLYEGVAIRVRNSSHVTVRNCKITGYRYGILVEDSNNITIENNQSTHNYRKFSAGYFVDSAAITSENFGGGIRVWRGSRVRIIDNEGDNQMSGIELIATIDSEVVGNRFNYDQIGLYLGRSSRNLIENNNFDWGIRFETRTWTDGSRQTLVRGGVFDFLDRGLLRVDDHGFTNGLPVKRILRLMDRDTSRPFWDLATTTLDSAGILIENASHQNRFEGNSFNFGGDGLFIRANRTPCSNGNLVINNEAAFSPNNGLELSFCEAKFEDNLVYANNHGMWLGAGAHDVVIRDNRFANNYSYAILGTRNGPVLFESNTVSETPVAIAMRAERWRGSLNLRADGSVVRTRDWVVQDNDFRSIRGGVFDWMLLGENDSAVFRLSGVERFNAMGNSYDGETQRCHLPHPFPARDTPTDVDMSIDCVDNSGVPTARFLDPTNGAEVKGGAHHTFVCQGADDQALRSIEIVFNDEHNARCEFDETDAVRSHDCRFENFYVGSDLTGRTIPMDCHVTDWQGQIGSEHINVTIGSGQTDTDPPYVRFTSPTDGQSVNPGFNDFTCYASDNKNLDYIEITFNNEHRHRCDFGPVTNSNCTFSNFYVGSDLVGRSIPMRCEAYDLAGNGNSHNIAVPIGSGQTDTDPPYVRFTSPTDGQNVNPGFNDFTCYASDNKNLDFIEITFNNEHRHRCDFGPVTNGNCTFSNFYVGSDLVGRSIPMRCEAYDLAGNGNSHNIAVPIGSGQTDTDPPYVRFTSPTDGQNVNPGFNDFTCYASDNKNLDFIEITFNNEHRHRCDFGPVTNGNCTFSNFDVGSDLVGRSIPMRCEAYDLAGNGNSHNIAVPIGSGSSDTDPPYVRFTSPTDGQSVNPGFNNFTCYASDNKNLDFIEITFNNEHRHRCDFGPVTNGNCTFSNFYVGSDLVGRNIPMRCEAYDLGGNRNSNSIRVLIQ